MFDRLKKLRRLNNSKLTDDEYYETDANGRGVIDVGAENYDDIFSYYDLDGENVLDREFSEFVEAKAEAIPPNKELTLHFHVKDATEEKRDEIDRVIKKHYSRELRAINRKLHRNATITLYILMLAIISVGLLYLVEYLKAHDVVIYLVDIMAWVFWWEVVDNHFLQRRKIQDERLKIYRFIRADIEVYEYRKPNRKTAKKQIGSKKIRQD